MKKRMQKSTTRWALMAAVCALFVPLALSYNPDYHGYVELWVLKLFRAASGAALGYLISRVFTKLHLSEFTDPYQRVEASKTQAYYVVGMAIAAAVG